EKILPHEVFHVLSNQNPKLREKLYTIVGFHPCNEVQLPPALAVRKLTNPDAPVNNHYMTSKLNDRDVEWMPILLSKSDHYDTQRGGNLFSYLEFKLLALETDDSGRRRPALRQGQAILESATGVPSFYQRIGRNTTYIIHPEEVLAENFVLL